MKKFLCGIFSLALLFSLSGCAGKQSSETNMTPAEMAEAIVKSQSELPKLSRLTSADTDFASWISVYYLIPDEQVKEGAIYYADGVEACEIAVLALADEADAEEVRTALDEYIEKRAGLFEGYAPKQAVLAKNGMVSVRGGYMALLICEDTAAAETAFLSCFGENSSSSSSAEDVSNKDSIDYGAESAVPESDVYDADAVLSAWKSGDTSALSDRNRQILEMAENVIAQEIKEGMSDYEKELAIHDWTTARSSFDYGIFGRSSSEGVADGSDTPYGVLIGRSAMCHGYSSTFQLFMDMLDIECITVYGTPGSNGVEHSWNMVRLDDEWYCVDVAWDDPIGGSPGHMYFNVTSEYLRSGSIHRWDDTSVPEAAGTAYAYGRQ